MYVSLVRYLLVPLAIKPPNIIPVFGTGRLCKLKYDMAGGGVPVTTGVVHTPQCSRIIHDNDNNIITNN